MISCVARFIFIYCYLMMHGFGVSYLASSVDYTYGVERAETTGHGSIVGSLII